MASVTSFISLNKFYIGSCFDITNRLEQHFSKEDKISFTAKTNDWTIFLTIHDLDYKEARNIETHIKKMKH